MVGCLCPRFSELVGCKGTLYCPCSQTFPQMFLRESCQVSMRNQAGFYEKLGRFPLEKRTDCSLAAGRNAQKIRRPRRTIKEEKTMRLRDRRNESAEPAKSAKRETIKACAFGYGEGAVCPMFITLLLAHRPCAWRNSAARKREPVSRKSLRSDRLCRFFHLWNVSTEALEIPFGGT